MELCEFEARDSIRGVVARYNANGDSGRFEAVLELFTDDARSSSARTDRQSRTKAFMASPNFSQRPDGRGSRLPRHEVPCPMSVISLPRNRSNIDDAGHARDRSYVAVVMAHGLDHWGRYIDEYVRQDGRWLISYRRAVTDGRAAGSIGS